MTLLDSFDEPVIPTEFYERCLDAHHDAALSRQVLHFTLFSDSILLFILTILCMLTVKWSEVHSSYTI